MKRIHFATRILILKLNKNKNKIEVRRMIASNLIMRYVKIWKKSLLLVNFVEDSSTGPFCADQLPWET